VVWQYVNTPDPPLGVAALIPTGLLSVLFVRVVLRMDWQAVLPCSLNFTIVIVELPSIAMLLAFPVPGEAPPIWNLWKLLLPPVVAVTVGVVNLGLIPVADRLSFRLRTALCVLNVGIAACSVAYFLRLSAFAYFDTYLSLVAAATFLLSAAVLFNPAQIDR
jgi:hypothetical protein